MRANAFVCCVAEFGSPAGVGDELHDLVTDGVEVVGVAKENSGTGTDLVRDAANG